MKVDGIVLCAEKEVSTLCDIQSGYPFSSSYFNPFDGVPLIRIRDLKPNRTETLYSGEYDEAFVVSDGDVLIGMDGDFQPCLWKGGKALLNQRVCRLVRKDETNLRWLFFALMTPLKKIEERTYYTTVKHLSVKTIHSILLPCPPLPEQKKIAAVLSKLQRAIEVQEQLIQSLRDLKKSAMNHLFTHGLRGEKLKKTEIGMMPGSWDVVAVGDCVTRYAFERCKQIPSSAYQRTGEYPVVDQGQQLIAGYTDDANLVLSEGLPLIVFGDHTRAMKFVEFPFAVGADGTKLLTPNADFDRLYLFYALNVLKIPSRGYNRHFQLLVSAKIPKPSRPEQVAIAKILWLADRSVAVHESQKASLQALFKTMLNKLMTGQVRVKDLDIDTAEVEVA